MNISSLLCTDDPPKKPPLRPTPSPPPSPTISPNTRLHSPPSTQEPVILAPHLRGHHSSYPHPQQRVRPLELPPTRERGPDRDLGQHIRKRSFSPDTPRDPSPARRPVYITDNKEESLADTPRSAHSGHSVANFALQQLQQQQQQRPVQREVHMDPSPFASSAQRSTYAQQRPSSSDMSMGYHSRPSSSHSHSPTLSHYSSAQSPALAPAPPTSLSRITTNYPFPREGPSPTPLATPQQRRPGSPLIPFYPSSRPPPQQQQQPHRLSPHSHSHPHSHSPILNSATPYTYPPVPSQQQHPTTSVVRPGSSSGSMPTTPYTAHHHHHLPHPQQHHLSTSTPASAISPYMGLEALVHAASQEHKRINANTGGRTEGGNSNSSSSSRSRHKHRNSLDERRVSSSSPVMDRNSGAAYPTTPVSPHRSHYRHHADERRSSASGSGYPHPSEAVSDARYAATPAEFEREREYEQQQQQRVGTLVPVPVTYDMPDPRPIKRQRMSDPLAGPISGMPGAEERERNFAAHYGRRSGHGQGGQQQQQQHDLPTRLSGPGAHEYPVTDRAILGFEGNVGVSVGDVGDGDSGERSRAAVLEGPATAAAPLPALPQAQPPKRRTSSGSASGPGKARRERSAEVKVEQAVSEGRPQLSTSTSTSSRAQTPLPPVPPPLDIKPNQRAKFSQSNKEQMQNKEKEKGQPQVLTKVKEQDAHEWLLEHYAGSTSSPSSTTPTSSSVTKVRGGQSGATLSGSRSSMEPARSRTPAPEIANALERELELELDDDSGSSTNHHHHRHREPDNTDPDVALEMVVESLDADTNDNDNDADSHDRDAARSSRVSMEVDEELLSLVDDPVPTPAPMSLPPPPPAPRQYAAPPPALRLTKPLTPTVVTVISPPFPSPGLGPASPFTPNLASERGSMPPPSAITGLAGKGGTEKKADGVSATASMKGKKATAPKSAPKQKQPAKPRAKAASKAKAKPAVDGTGPALAAANKSSKSTPMPAPAIKKSAAAVGSASRSRSTSVMPGGIAAPEGDIKIAVVEPEKDPEAEEDGEDKEDDKLYCVCKTRYEEDRVMIACDRCDEWYHTQCVNMPDLEIDLVDQFICPPCIENNPQLHLQTTYRKRCHRGLHHPNPSSPDACHKPARGEFSKYCSDECGVKFMGTKIDAWVKNGGNKEKLWESVRHAERREGVVKCVDPPKDEAGDVKPITQKVTRVERDLEKLTGQLDQIMRKRETLKKQMDVVVWRARVVELATERSEQVDECAWDQRLCFGDDEYAEFGTAVLASYGDNAAKEELTNEAEDAMQVDAVAEDGAWWCRGKKKCERHPGWQKLRAAEVSFEKEMKEAGLLKLTTQEREIRKRIEDLLEPQTRNPHFSTPLKSSSRKLAVNGHTKRANGDIVKKGKKKRT